ncbi:MAG TPA: hypothetical protein VGF86_16015 [Candidatus Tumulicola sp.]|jgi:hypothetical protein
MRRIFAAILIVQLAACSGAKGTSSTGGATTSPSPAAAASSPASPPSAALTAAAQIVGKDPATALAFVQGVRYEVYPGVFRGAVATLTDAAGNDYDRALLLHDLLATANPGAPIRYAFCTLSPQQADAALAAARAAYVAPAVAANAQMLAQKATTPKLHDGFLQIASFWKAASAQEQAQGAQVATDLQKTGAQPSAGHRGDVHAIAADHVWVQMQSGASWVDFDPGASNAKPGATVCAPAKTRDALPDAAYDTVSTTLHLETRGSAQPNATVASQAWRTANLADQALVFAFGEPLGLQSPAPQPSGMNGFTPVLMAGTQITAAVPIVVPIPKAGPGLGAAAGAVSQAAAAFGNAPAPTPTPTPLASGPVPIALVLDVTVSAPNVPSVTVTRPIFDRISAADRAAGRAATAPLLPLTIYPFGTVWSVAVNFGTGVAGGGDGKPVAVNTDDPKAIGLALGAMQRAYYSTRRAVFADALGTSAPPVMGARPTVTFVGLTPFTAGPVPYGLAMDRATEGASPDGADAAASVAWGVASVYAERLAVAAPAMMKRSDTLDVLPFDDALEMFYIARHTDIPPAIVRSSADVAALPVSEDAKARLTASIAGGKSAVVPSKPVSYGGSNDVGWWTLAADGSVSDEMQNGMHFDMEGEALTDEEIVAKNAITYRRNGFIVRCVGLAAGALMSLAVVVNPGGEGAKEIAEQAAEQIKAIDEANEAEEMREDALRCAE